MAGFLPVEELEVYKLAEQLADEIWNMVIQWDFFARDVIGKQLCRAADSVGANIAEGGGDGERGENRRFVRYARRSLKEVRFFLRRAHARQLITEESIARLKPLIDVLGPKLTAYYHSIKLRRAPLNNSTT